MELLSLLLGLKSTVCAFGPHGRELAHTKKWTNHAHTSSCSKPRHRGELEETVAMQIVRVGSGQIHADATDGDMQL